MAPKGRFGGLIPANFFSQHQPLVVLVAIISVGGAWATYYSLRTLTQNPDIQPNRFKADPTRHEDQFSKGNYKFIDHRKDDPIVPYRMTPSGEIKESKK